MAVFVTVGTTLFDDLIEVVDTKKFHTALFNLGYKKIFIQYGNGSIVPSVPDSPLEIDAFRFRTNLSSIFSQSSLVISHGGAGTCMEALQPPGKCKLIVVINESLMNNHQVELASTLYEEKHALVSRVKDLYEFISTGEQHPFLDCLRTKFWGDCDNKTLFGPSTSPQSVGFVPFHRGNVSNLIDFLNNLMDVSAS
nr:UDP N acetylglucosamine transferase subunit [Hymenolepis microstoma]CUU97827.1 UDP N acetylglucosamine transferase subunit [Hymenolepis microstoma]